MLTKAGGCFFRGHKRESNADVENGAATAFRIIYRCQLFIGQDKRYADAPYEKPHFETCDHVL